MEKLDTLTVFHESEPRYIEIYQGDLTRMSPQEAVDVLVVSAFPNEYSPAPRSLIGALHRKGVSVEQLALDKADDLRPTFPCWLSKPVKTAQAGLHFKCILCFEPWVKGLPAEVVADIFQCLAQYTSPGLTIQSVAMPLLATGYQDTPLADILVPLVEGAVQWMSRGLLAVQRLKIVAVSSARAQELKGAFAVLKRQYEQQRLNASHYPYDLFVSYAHANSEAVELALKELNRLRPSLRLFLDRVELQVGMVWQQELFDALESSRGVLAFYSPDYLASRMCKFEHTLALSRQIETSRQILLPILLKTTELPRPMRMTQYLDCSNDPLAKLVAACPEILRRLDKLL